MTRNRVVSELSSNLKFTDLRHESANFMASPQAIGRGIIAKPDDIGIILEAVTSSDDEDANYLVLNVTIKQS